MPRGRCTYSIQRNMASMVVGSMLLVFPITATAQEQAEVDLDQIGRICAGFSEDRVSSDRSSATYKDFSISVTADNSLEISRQGVLLSQIIEFTAEDYRKCIVEIINALRAAETASGTLDSNLVVTYSVTTEEGIRFDLTSCYHEGTGVRCDFFVTSQWEDRDLSFYSNDFRGVIGFTDIFASEVRLSNDTGRSSITNDRASARMIRGIPFSGSFAFAHFDDRPTAFSALQIDLSREEIVLRNVAIAPRA